MPSLQGRKVALIGGAGFIGHHLALDLKKRGAEVSIVDALGVNHLLQHFTANVAFPEQRSLYLRILMERLDVLRDAGVDLYTDDARNYYALRDRLQEIRPHAIVQLAAVAHAAKSNREPHGTFEHSFQTLENALDVARLLPVEHFVYFSSSMVYGNFPKGFVVEDTPCNPIGIYGALKFAGEKLVIAFNQVFDLPYTIIRPSALYGPRCVSRRVGQIFIESALQGLDLTVSGDGSDRLDFTYIGDLVQGVRKVLESEKSHCEIFNITYGESRSIAEMAEIVKQHFTGIGVNYEPKDRLMPDRGTLSVKKAHDLIGYEPEYPLEKGYVDYINWYKGFWA